MRMKEWLKKLDGFLTINDRDILNHAGKISHEMAKQLAENEYAKYNTIRITGLKNILSDFDKAVKQVESNKPNPGGKSKKE